MQILADAAHHAAQLPGWLTGVTWVAIAGFVISATNGIVSIVQGVRNRSRLVVTLTHVAFTPSAKPRVLNVLYTVTVQNLGKQPQTVWDVGLKTTGEYKSSLRYARQVQRNFAHSNPSGTDPATFQFSDGPTLPSQIPVGGVVDWVFENVATSSRSDDDAWRGYATRLRGKKKVVKQSKNGITRSGVESWGR